MSAGITNSLACIAAIQDLATRLISDAKSKSFLAFLMDSPVLFADVKTLSVDAAMALPELSSLDGNEVSQLGAASYALVMAVIKAAQG